MRNALLALALLAVGAAVCSGCNSSCSVDGDCLNANWTCQDGRCVPPAEGANASASSSSSGSGSSGSGTGSSGSSGTGSSGSGSGSGSTGGP